MEHALSSLIAIILRDLGVPRPEVTVTVPENPAHGDYTTNVAMTVAKTLKKPPMEIALSVIEKLKIKTLNFKLKERDQKIGKRGHSLSPLLPQFPLLQAIDHVEVAAPGFINIFLTEASLITQLQEVLKPKEAAKTGKTIMVEFAHPNTHKAFHIGHLRNITTGESIVRLLEAAGHRVIRTNYQGDVGMHIAKALYGLLHEPHGTHKTHMTHASLPEKVAFLGKAYAAGSKAFEEDEAAKREIGEINKNIYAKDPQVFPLYRETRQWSLDYFDGIYKRVGSRFDRFYFESEVYESGKKLALAAINKGVLVESDGAVIFPGKNYGLHNRVFVTREGNATYEGKELGLATLETTEFGRLDKLIHVVGPEQASFFQVTFQAEELLGIVKPGVQHHLIYGWVKLKHGKMSSRSGNVVLGEWLLDEAKKAIYDIIERNTSKNKSLDPSASSVPLDSSQRELIAEKAAVAAVKYAFLKVSTTSEIAFDIQTSVSFDGDSGPYLQYTYARAKSVLRKAQQSTKHEARNSKGLEHLNFDIVSDFDIRISNLNVEERNVCRLLIQFPDVVAEAAETYSPSTICTYLFRLAQAFNLFYAKHSILGSPLRLALTAAIARVLKTGLYLLGIEILEQM